MTKEELGCLDILPPRPIRTQAELAAMTREFEENLAAAEKARRGADRVISLTCGSSGLVALTETGRLFERSLDNRNFDHRNPLRYQWREIAGPLE